MSKYSQTNFSFPIIFINLKQQLIYKNDLFSLIFIPNRLYKTYSLIILNKQKSGSFLVKSANSYGLRPSSIYNMLKSGKNFINWEGTIYKGQSFCSLPKIGDRFIINSDFFNRRVHMEIDSHRPKKRSKNYLYKNLYKEFFFQEYKY